MVLRVQMLRRLAMVLNSVEFKERGPETSKLPELGHSDPVGGLYNPTTEDWHG
jgi:hypothetical protein